MGIGDMKATFFSIPAVTPQKWQLKCLAGTIYLSCTWSGWGKAMDESGSPLVSVNIHQEMDTLSLVRQRLLPRTAESPASLLPCHLLPFRLNILPWGPAHTFPFCNNVFPLLLWSSRFPAPEPDTLTRALCSAIHFHHSSQRSVLERPLLKT